MPNHTIILDAHSILLCVFLSLGILTMIIVRTLRRDIAKYNKIDEEVGLCLPRCFFFVASTVLLLHCLHCLVPSEQ